MVFRVAHLVALAGLIALSACASPDGPGSLAGVSPATPQPVTAVQTAPLPGAVASQPLAAPGQQALAQPTFAQPAQPQTAAGQIALDPSTLSNPAGRQDFNQAQNQSLTLQDFSTIDPRPVEGSDPFADQRQPSFDQQTRQETLQQAIQSGLQPQDFAAQQPAEPVWPRVSLAPITTAPEPHATQLFDAIDDAVFDRGMQFAFFGDETAQYVVRSQVSAIPAEAVTSVIYVFDIFDARGNLRHRVSGARSIPRSGPDGWALVDNTVKQLIAEDVATRMMTWLRSNPA